MLQLGCAYLPIILLIYLMSKNNNLPANYALPLAALAALVVVYFVFKLDTNMVFASLLAGLLSAWTPILIIAGAIFLFRCMEISSALPLLRQWLNTVSVNPVAQLMIIAWAFAFLIEGASGFGTPAAIAAPILVSLGFPPLRVAVCCLIMNSVPVTFGAVGTPVWFGLSVLDLAPQQVADIAWKSAFMNTIAAPFVVLAALALVLEEKRLLRKNLLFIVLSTFSCTLPYLALSTINVEFPSLIGGLCGLLVTLVLAKRGTGLSDSQSSASSPSSQPSAPLSLWILCKAGFPLWGTVLLLILTRVPELGLKSLLQLGYPAWQVSLGQLGNFSISAALVLKLEHILQTNISWQHSTLYIPSFIPFLLIGVLTLWWFKQGSLANALRHTQQRMQKPVVALMGALVFVNLMMAGQAQSAVNLIGQHLASLSGGHWDLLAPFLGALGSFFSGSATISNLTFAGIQHSIAMDLGLNLTSILALQLVGAAMGNMICINNIVAVASVLALQKQEGYILKRTMLVVLMYGLIAGLSGWLLNN